jgi:blocked-early-in-transport protein 1
LRASSLYSSGSSHEIDEHDNEQEIDGLQDRVNHLKKVSLVFTITFNKP